MLIHRPPARALSPLVSVLWHAEAWKPPHRRERRMPDGCAGIVISLDPASPFTIFAGPSSESVILDIGAAPDVIMGAHFTPGGAAAFIQCSVSDVRNASVSLIDVTDSSAVILAERLLECRTAAARLALLERWLMSRLMRSATSDQTVLWAARQLKYPQTRVADVTSQIGHSSRWFINRFAEEVGLTPKVFSRVQRFQAALRFARRPAVLSLGEVALAAGYFDQAHLTHEFKAIAGMPPTAVLAGRTGAINHVVDLESA